MKTVTRFSNSGLMIILGVLWLASPSSAETADTHAKDVHARASSKTSINRPASSRSSNRNSNVNVNRNVNRDVNVNVDVDHHDDHWNDWDDHHHPVRTAAEVTAAVAVTSAVIGSIVHTVPSGCVTTIVNGIAYQQCGSTWYQPQYYGTNVQYIVVVSPR